MKYSFPISKIRKMAWASSGSDRLYRFIWREEKNVAPFYLLQQKQRENIFVKLWTRLVNDPDHINEACQSILRAPQCKRRINTTNITKRKLIEEKENLLGLLISCLRSRARCNHGDWDPGWDWWLYQKMRYSSPGSTNTINTTETKGRC